ncbi:hypothetical protein [Streptomyces flaveolus]|jgi:hypothetical protein|uniref:hypothetical protein n=1 Tax=Streptomyces flaveolus TaxID=67297 RepID=UPI001670982D|nr:hypothetical protein [Streptomyces flaveolus]GGQ62081.1 hypothetical protein GCM10010216_24920 [Streptomyces flaveolus]
MAHAVPTGRKPAGAIPRGTTPDVFGPRTHLVAKWAVPVVAGLIYGYWAAANRRYGGPVTGWNLLFGFMTALAFVVLYAVVRAVAARLPREGHAVLWGAFAGSALGFLYAQSGVAMFTCILASLLLAGAVTAALFYVFYSREDATGHRIP